MRVRAKKTEDWWNKGEEATEELVSVNTDELRRQQETSSNDWGNSLV